MIGVPVLIDGPDGEEEVCERCMTESPVIGSTICEQCIGEIDNPDDDDKDFWYGL